MENNMRERDIIIRPILSEKSYAGIENKRYTFEVWCDSIEFCDSKSSEKSASVAKTNEKPKQPTEPVADSDSDDLPF